MPHKAVSIACPTPKGCLSTPKGSLWERNPSDWHGLAWIGIGESFIMYYILAKVIENVFNIVRLWGLIL